MSLKDLFDNVLVDYEVRGADAPDWYGQLVTMRDVLESDPGARVQLVKMDEPRERTDAGGSIKLHQGRSSSTEAGKYPGDAKMCDSAIVTAQLHWLRIAGFGAQPIPALAVHIPQALRKDDVITQGT